MNPTIFTIHQVLPIPLQGQTAISDVWQCEQKVLQGRRYFVLAASGRGKTTLQHILYGIRKDYTGQVNIEGQLSSEKPQGGSADIRQLSLAQWAYLRQSRIAVVFQDLRLFPALSALENIQLKNQLTQFKTEAEITAMAARLGVDTLLQKKCGEMSYGQRQRVAIIRALCQPFESLLMDEPFSHLDKENIRLSCELIQEECSRQKAGYLLASLGDKYDLQYDEEWQL